MKTLDLEAVQAFVLIADLRSFTRAAQAIDSTQAAVSLKIKRLEERLGRRLIERTPRWVRLSGEGLAFIDAARELVSSHERAVRAFAEPRPQRLVIGISHLMVGPDLPALLRSVNPTDGALQVELRVAGSRELLKTFDEGGLDAAIVLQDEGELRRGAELLFSERYVWVASPDWLERQAGPLRLATQGEACSVRAAALRTLDAAGIAWTEVFIGKGAAMLGAAAAAGLAATVMARRAAPAGTVEIGSRLRLPELPATQAVLYSTAADPKARAVLKVLAGALKKASGR